jgi:hypothetical protein
MQQKPTDSDRLARILAIVNDVRHSGLTQGHQVLIRFVYDLRDHMGWPTTDPRAWRLHKDTEAGAQKWLKSFVPYLGPGNNVTGWGYETKLLVQFGPVTATGNIVDFDVEVKKIAGADVASATLWALTFGEINVGTLDASSPHPAEDVLKKSATIVSQAIYHAMWK